MSDQTITDPDSTPTLLLAGFEPFGAFAVNPAWELARSFDGHYIERVLIRSAQLPVAWDAAWPALLSVIEQLHPTWVLLLGLAEKRQVVTVELRGKNLANPLKDNKGNLPPAEEIIAGGPEFLNATVPAPLLVERISEAGAPAAISSDAGGYLCNATLYQALAWAQEQPEIDGVGFIHVPLLPEQGGPGITMADMSRGLEAAIATLVGGKVPSVEELIGLAEE